MRDRWKEELAYATHHAKLNQECLRKAVGVSIVDRYGHRLVVARNGPSVPGSVCSNVKGGCGCCHAEVRAVLELTRRYRGGGMTLLCTYSPCTNCANIIIECGMISRVCRETLTEHDTRGEHFLKLAGIEVVEL